MSIPTDNILKTKPPIYDRLVKKFNVSMENGLIIAYYPNIHCLFKVPDLKIVHEAVHLVRQEQMGVSFWWEKYLEDEQFRLEEELLAYGQEIRAIKELDISRNERRFLLKEIYENLSSSMYGNLITKEEAKQILS